MTPNRIRKALPHIQRALSHLIQCWDELTEAEHILDTEISVEKLSHIAVHLDYPQDSRRVTASQILEWLKSSF